MRQSNLFIPTLREFPKDAEIISHKLLIKGGYIKQVAAGIYTYLPLAKKVISNIEKIIREELDAIGCNEILMPAMQPKKLWVESGRWDKMGGEMIRLVDRKDTEFCLGPTHEEVITYLVKDYVNSYKKLPLSLYQIQSKFRDELRPRYGLMRGREFVMKDLYTFHTDKEDLRNRYNEISDAYLRIFSRCGLDVKRVEADNGSMGGDSSHEFMAISDVGEDTVIYCESCSFGENAELENHKVGDNCPNCGRKLNSNKGIELGHIFELGSKYTDSLKALYLDKEQKKQSILMGCYGIGVSRIIMAIVEQNNNENSIFWPKEISPYDIHLICVDTKKEVQVAEANKIYSELKSKGFNVLFDDRNERAGVKFKDADLVGIRKRITIGKDIENGIVEFKNILNGDLKKISYEEIIDIL